MKRAQVLAYVYIVVNFQLRSSIHAGLTERSLYNRFALKNLPKWGFWGILGGGVKIFGGNPSRNAMTTDLRRLVKNYGDAPNTLVCTLGKAITNKNTVLTRRVSSYGLPAWVSSELGAIMLRRAA